MVADRCEELLAEADILREELGGLVRELRRFIRGIRDSEFGEIDRLDIADILEEIIDA